MPHFADEVAKAWRGQGMGSAPQAWPHADRLGRYHSVTRQLLRKADGVVLMYDVTSQESFAHVRHWLDCLQVSRWLLGFAPVWGTKRELAPCPHPPFLPGLQMTQQTRG